MASPEQNGRPRPPFISTQRLWRLVCPPEHQEQCLRPENQWTLPRGQDGDSETVRPIEIHGVPQGVCRWERVNDRSKFLMDTSIKRLCLTVDAGGGKTTALQQTQYLRHLSDAAGLALWMDFADLPEDFDDFLGDGGGSSKLVKWLGKSPGMKGLDRGTALSLLHRRVRQGGLSLLVDALDQSRGLGPRRESCVALCDFLLHYSEVRCVVTGRPFAIRRYWHELFEPRRFGGHEPWEFVLIDAFTEAEARQYVGETKMGLLKQLGADVLAVPRSLQMICNISETEKDLGALRTKSDVYWAALNGMLVQALQGLPGDVGLREEQARRFFSLIGWEMTRQGFGAGSAGVRAGREYEAFVGRVWSNHLKPVKDPKQEAERSELRDAFGTETIDQFHEKLGRLCAVNEHLTDPALEGRQHPEAVHLFWRNQTLQDMFTAVWMTRYARPAEAGWLYGERAKAGRRELWQLTAEMGVAARDNQVFPGTVGTVYRSPVAGHNWWRWWRLLVRAGGPAPACEWIYRSWHGMVEAGLERSISNETQLRAETAALQREARRLVQEASSIPAGYEALRDPANPARDVLLRFLGEFPLIRRGARGREAQRIAEEFESSFRWVPDNPEDSLACWMGEGASLKSTKIPGRFRLSRYPVTNELMGLWDLGHRSRESGYHKRSPDPRCPAIHVDWYTAWCVSVWLGGYLPTEKEWEYACRAQPLSGEATLESHPPTDYCFGNRKQQLQDYAWYEGNAEGRTHPVGQKYANSFDLCDMHGNVDEWCDSWYEQGVYRVYRGGGWFRVARRCRSASRDGDEPSSRDGILGFRVAQVPSSK